jgi:hypothetical protein
VTDASRALLPTIRLCHGGRTRAPGRIRARPRDENSETDL